MPQGRELLGVAGAIAAAYALGCFCTGYYWVRYRTGQDIRQTGSGNVGAKNVGRLLGAPGFAIAFLGDLTKGALAVWVAGFLDGGAWAGGGAMLGVVAGHLFPAQLGFRGGKGVATVLGALLILDWRLLVPLLALLAAALAVSRSFTVSGLVSLLSVPFSAWGLGSGPATLWTGGLVTGLILVAHRGNIALLWARTREERRAASGGPEPPCRK